jgi:hypothetical protein
MSRQAAAAAVVTAAPGSAPWRSPRLARHLTAAVAVAAAAAAAVAATAPRSARGRSPCLTRHLTAAVAVAVAAVLRLSLSATSRTRFGRQALVGRRWPRLLRSGHRLGQGQRWVC